MRKTGFTLIESVIVIIVMGVAMITIINFLAPQIARSGDPHYQSRAAALGQSLMSHILSMEFDHNSNQSVNGGEIRCADARGGVGGPDGPACTPAASLGAEESDITLYNDVDDYIGCWQPEGNGGCKNLNTLLGQTATSYQNFQINVSVSYDGSYTAFTMKQIDLTITASNQQPIRLIALRGNY